MIDEEGKRRFIGTRKEGGRARALLVPGTYTIEKHEKHQKHQMHKTDRSDNDLHRSVTL